MSIDFLTPKSVKTVFVILILIAVYHPGVTTGDDAVPYLSITPMVESAISRTATIVLRHIAQARSDIHRKAWTGARRNLTEAARLMDTIRDDLSTAPAKNLIRIARTHLEYEQEQRVLLDLPPIYSSLEAVSVYLPTDRAKMHLDRAKEFLERNNKRGAERELALADKSLIVIEVEQPLLKSQRYVKKAEDLLAAGKGHEAEQALRVAESRVMALYAAAKLPVFQAKQNAWLAFRNYSTARHEVASTYLKQARINLEKSAASGNTKGAIEAGKISLEIADLEKKLAGEGQIAESALKSAWERSEALAERSAAYLSAGLSEAEPALGGESNLIEARLHVAYAETYQITTNEPVKAIKELDTAYAYLQKAAKNRVADESDRKKIHGIDTIIQALKSSPEKGDASVAESYDKIKEVLSDLADREELSGLIRRM